MWVGAPFPIELGSHPPTLATGAHLSCEPVFMDWSSVGAVHIFGEAIVPGATYSIQVVDSRPPYLACYAAAASDRNPQPLILPTSRWGDIVGSTLLAPPDGGVGFRDVAAVVDAYVGQPGALDNSRVDLQPGLPDQVIGYDDILQVVGAFAGGAYPFAGPSMCP